MDSGYIPPELWCCVVASFSHTETKHTYFCLSREILYAAIRTYSVIHIKESFVDVCKCGLVDVLRYMLDARNGIRDSMDIPSILSSGLCAACKSGQVDMVHTLLSLSGVDTIDVNTLYRKSFYVACQRGHLSIVKSLLDARKNMKASDLHETGFTLACTNGHVDIVDALLKITGHDMINVIASNSFTGTCRAGHLPVVKRLLGLTGTRRIVDLYKGLLWACVYAHEDIVQYLMSLEDERKISKETLKKVKTKAHRFIRYINKMHAEKLRDANG